LTLAACGGGSKTSSGEDSSIKVAKTGFPIVDSKIKMSLMAPGSGKNWSKMETLTDYAKKTNIDFSYTTPPMSDFATKLNLAFASGDIADVIFGAGSQHLSRAQEIDYGSQGILVPLEDLIPDYAPNLNKLLKENPDIKKSITAPDGHIYSLPMLSDGDTGIWPIGPLWYNGDWLKNLGVTELPKTLDDFYQLLVRFRDEDPNRNGKKDEIPLTEAKLELIKTWLMPAFGIFNSPIQVDDAGKVSYNLTSPEYKEFLTFMNKLYTEKLLDPEVYSQADEQKKAKGRDNRIGLFPDYYSFFTTGLKPNDAVRDPMFQPLSKTGKDIMTPISSQIQTGAFAITKNNKSPKAAMRWVDYFYTKEGFEYLNQGPAGALWDWQTNDKGEKVKVFTDRVKGEEAEEVRSEISPDYGIATPERNITLPSIKEKVNDPDRTPFELFVKSETEKKIAPYGKVPFPIVYLMKAEQDEVNESAAEAKLYNEEMEAKFITGVEPLSNWDKYVETMNKMKIKDYTKIYQGVYDRWAKE
jgi:putative aldouronate transport system substrate-binding protein